MLPAPRVLITGSAGNVGSTVFTGLAPHFALRAFDLKPTPGAADMHVGDIADRAAVDRAVAGIDTIIHFGGCPRMEADFLRDLVQPNIVGLWNILDAARLAGVKRVIFASSTNVAFGATQQAQLTTDTVHVFNPYGATKAFGENLGRWFHDTYGLDFLAARIGYFRGLSDDPGLHEAWLHRIWLGPRDCVKFFRLAVAAPSFGYGIAYASSRCPENYLDLTSARDLIGYEPEETVPAAP